MTAALLSQLEYLQCECVERSDVCKERRVCTDENSSECVSVIMLYSLCGVCGAVNHPVRAIRAMLRAALEGTQSYEAFIYLLFIYYLFIAVISGSHTQCLFSPAFLHKCVSLCRCQPCRPLDVRNRSLWISGS